MGVVRFILILLCVFLSFPGLSQTWKWAKAGGGTLNDAANDLAIDETDNVYVIGTYTGQASFDGETITGTGVNSFLIKYDSSGVKKWLLNIPGNLKKITIDPNNSNNIVSSGTFSGTILVGGN